MKKGVFIFPNGDTYEGDFWMNEDGSVERHGMGTFAGVDGLRYQGEWHRDKMNGRGKLTHPSGASYEGQFAMNKYFGSGKYVFPDGSYYEGKFVDNKYKDKIVDKIDQFCGVIVFYILFLIYHHFRVQGHSQFTDSYGQVWKGTFHPKGATALKFKLEV